MRSQAERFHFNTRPYLFVMWAAFALMFQQTVANAQSDAYSTSEKNLATRSDVVMPVVTFFLPGASQWVAGQYGYAGVYSGTAVGGVIYALNAQAEINQHDQKNSDLPTSKGISERKYQLGLQVAQVAQGFSLFQSFRTAARLRQDDGQYQFIHSNPQPEDLALAPFHVQYLLQPTTYIPLVIGLGLNLWIATSPAPDGWVKDSFRREDAAFAAGFSYNAGTHEEAIFRGWLMPVFREYWMNDTWANGMQAAVFGAAHLSTTPLPIIQVLLGWHLGSITQKNGWDMREAVFIHAWWDVMSFAAQYHLKKQDPTDASIVRLYLPPLTYGF